MPPSITFWNRLEPRPRTNSIAESLAAPVRDPLWLLARQWQVGEFAASDCGSPVYVDLRAQAGPLVGWASANGASRPPWTGPMPPIEPTVEDEPFSADLVTRAELGQWFEAMLGADPGQQMIEDLRLAYPLPLILDRNVDRLLSYPGSPAGLDSGAVPPDLLAALNAVGISISTASVWAVTPGWQWVITDFSTGLNYAVVKEDAEASIYLYRDAEALRFLRICAGRAYDGAAILGVAQSGAAILPTRAEWTPQQVQGLSAAGRLLDEAMRSVYGSIGFADPSAWSPDRLSFDLSVAATSGPAALDILKASPGRNGEFDWTSFDLATANGAVPGLAPGPMSSLNQTIMPGHVRFRGMPNARWWEFETAQTDFGAVQPEKRDLARLIFMDFMLIHGDDWYLVGLETPMGSVTQIAGLYVHDVFGVVTQIDRADSITARAGLSPGQQWTLFSPTWIGQSPKVGSYLVVPPSAWPTAMAGPTIEEARLVRDAVADLVWGVETVAENGVGRPWPGRERDRAGIPAQTKKPESAVGAPAVRYKLHTPLPGSWIPFVPVPQAGAKGLLLERAVLPGDVAGTVAPIGRILQTSRLHEQEVSTQGTIVSRTACRSRWIDGSTRLWIARRRRAGLGQETSGLRFDIAAEA